MNQKHSIAHQETTRFDGLKWLLVLILIAGGIVANYYFSTVAWAIRAAAGIVLSILILTVAAFTAKGKHSWAFMKGSRNELRKVIWPTRQETVQTTLVVVAMVVVTAVILWGLDSLFMWAVGWLTGQRG